MKAVPPHSLRLITPRDRQQPCDLGQTMVKGCIKTSDLRDTGEAVMKRLG